MFQSTHLELHREHQAWTSEAALWRDEVALWRVEAEAALAEAESRVEALRDDLQMLGSHEESIRAHLGRSRDYEHALAQFESAGSTDALLVCAKRHRGEGAQHVACSEAHAEVKNLHHAVMRDGRGHRA